MHLADKKIIIVGGTRGIGFATAAAAAARGARVVVTSRDPARVAAARERLAGAEGLAADFTNADQARAAFEQLGAFDHLVIAAASAAAWGPFAKLPASAVMAAMAAKVGLAWTTIQAALPHLARDGSITLVSGAAGRIALPGTAGLAVVNAGLNQLAWTLSKELAPIRVNAVCPGTTDTEAYGHMPPAEREAFYAGIGARLPVGRVGQPDEIAEAILLCADNGFLTGAVLDVDGGAR